MRITKSPRLHHLGFTMLFSRRKNLQAAALEHLEKRFICKMHCIIRRQYFRRFLNEIFFSFKSIDDCLFTKKVICNFVTTSNLITIKMSFLKML